MKRGFEVFDKHFHVVQPPTSFMSEVGGDPLIIILVIMITMVTTVLSTVSMKKIKLNKCYWSEIKSTDDIPKSLSTGSRGNLRRIRPSKSKLILLHSSRKAILVWHRKRNELGYFGIHCYSFLNKSKIRSELLLIKGENLAKAKWPDEWFFSYIHPKSSINISEKNLIVAEWKKYWVTKKGLHFFAKKISR